MKWVMYGCLVLIALSAAVRADEPAATASKKPEILDLFGHQEQNSKEPAKNLAESEQIIKRPDASASKNKTFSTEQKPLERKSKEAAVWRLQDWLPLGVVLGLIVGVGFVVKKFMPARALVGGAGLEIVTRMNVSNKQSVAVVKVGKKLLVIGICPDRINTLSVIDDPAEVAEFVGDIASRQPSSITQAFRKSFDREADRYPETSQPDVATATGGQVRGLLEKVRQLKGREVA